MFVTAFLGLGSNLGDRESNLDRALDELSAHDGIELRAVSEFINTKAVAAYEQPDYLNGACEIQTILSPQELLDYTQAIEIKLGRTSKGLYDPRTVDIDILFYGQDIISEDNLVIPHPMLHVREFVLRPLCEIAPTQQHPILQVSIESLLSEVVG